MKSITNYVPNILSFLRICFVPLFVFLYFSSEDYYHLSAFLVYLLASFTDFLDGFMARKFSATSKLGSVLDPLADKLMLISVLFVFYLDRKIPLFIFMIIFIKESILIASAAIMYFRKEQIIISSNIFGKVATILFTFSIILFFIASNSILSHLSILLAVLFKLLAFISYFKIWLSKL